MTRGTTNDWVECWGEGEQEKWKQHGTGGPEGWLGEGRGSHARRGPPMVSGSTGTGKTLGRAEEQKGVRPAFPCALGAQGTC